MLDKGSTTANRVNPSQSFSSASGNLLSHQNSPVIVERQIKSIQRHIQYRTQKPLLLSSLEQPENNDVAQLDEDVQANIVETAERDENTLATDDTAVIAAPPTDEVDENTADEDIADEGVANEGTIVSMLQAPNPKTSTTESSHENTGPTKEKSIRKRIFGILPGLLKRKPKA